VLLGACSGIVCFLAVLLVKQVMQVDDALDVLGVHGVGGALGSLLLPFLTVLGGGVALSRGIGDQFLAQALAVGVTAVWSGVMTIIITKFAALTVGLRVTREDETIGLDFAAHGESGYHHTAR
jgi:Amt family ammonium transporter